jgi:hypothetical protein
MLAQYRIRAKSGWILYIFYKYNKHTALNDLVRDVEKERRPADDTCLA